MSQGIRAEASTSSSQAVSVDSPKQEPLLPTPRLVGTALHSSNTAASSSLAEPFSSQTELSTITTPPSLKSNTAPSSNSNPAPSSNSNTNPTSSSSNTAPASSNSNTAPASSNSNTAPPSSTTTPHPSTASTTSSGPIAGLAESRAAVSASLSAIGSTYDADLQQRIRDLHAGSTAISAQERELARQTASLGQERRKWAQLADRTTRRLNEFGDLQNWAEVLERDLVVLEETVRLVEGRDDAGNESGVNRLSDE